MEELETIEMEISEPTRFNDVDSATQTAADQKEVPAIPNFLSFYLGKAISNADMKAFEEAAGGNNHEDLILRRDGAAINSDCQPGILRLPDVRSRWLDERWTQRAACYIKWQPYHLFYTRAKGDSLTLNKHLKTKLADKAIGLKDEVYGDAFLLSISITWDAGRRCDTDVNPELCEHIFRTNNVYQ